MYCSYWPFSALDECAAADFPTQHVVSALPKSSSHVDLKECRGQRAGQVPGRYTPTGTGVGWGVCLAHRLAPGS